MWTQHAARFWSRVDFGTNPQEGCWLWTGGKNGRGYGKFYANGKTYFAHRVAWLMLQGPITGEVLDHLCRTPACVNPAHLEPCSNRENIRRGRAGEYNRRKTHCPKGHPYSGENLLRVNRHRGPAAGKVQRECRTCWRERCRKASAAYQARLRLERDLRRGNPDASAQ